MAISMNLLDVYAPLAVPLHNHLKGSFCRLAFICKYHRAEIVLDFERQCADFLQRTEVYFAAHKAKIGMASVL